MKRNKQDKSVNKHAGIDVIYPNSIDAYLPYLQWEIIYIPDGSDFAKSEYIIYDANSEPSKEMYEHTTLFPGEIEEIDLVDEGFIEVDDPDAWAEEQIDLLLQRKPEVVRAILKERLLRGETIENEPKPKRSFAWNRSLAEIAHVLEKENCLPKGSVVFRKKGAILNLRKKLAFLYGNK